MRDPPRAGPLHAFILPQMRKPWEREVTCSGTRIPVGTRTRARSSPSPGPLLSARLPPGPRVHLPSGLARPSPAWRQGLYRSPLKFPSRKREKLRSARKNLEEEE